MKHIDPIYNDVNICFACNDKYAEPLCTMLYSLLKNSDRTRSYDILIMQSNISEENKRRLMRFAGENVSVRLIDASDFHYRVEGYGRNYISAETNYRLYLLSEAFSQYDRMLYLDCDMQVCDDICRLYDTDLEKMVVGACEAASMRALSIAKKAVFFDGMPCNVDHYRKECLGLSAPERYFNAGMLLLDLKLCRAIADEKRALEVLSAHSMQYNDQDCLNILFDGKVRLLDIRWNYSVAIPHALVCGNGQITKAYADLARETYGVVHYIGSHKPWDYDVPLGEIYRQNNEKMTSEVFGDDSK